jgi:hypothetical protein
MSEGGQGESRSQEVEEDRDVWCCVGAILM